MRFARWSTTDWMPSSEWPASAEDAAERRLQKVDFNGFLLLLFFLCSWCFQNPHSKLQHCFGCFFRTLQPGFCFYCLLFAMFLASVLHCSIFAKSKLCVVFSGFCKSLLKDLRAHPYIHGQIFVSSSCPPRECRYFCKRNTGKSRSLSIQFSGCFLGKVQGTT